MCICIYIFTYVCIIWWIICQIPQGNSWDGTYCGKQWSGKKDIPNQLKNLCVSLLVPTPQGRFWTCLILLLCSLPLFLCIKSKVLDNGHLPSNQILSLSLKKWFELLTIMHKQSLYWYLWISLSRMFAFLTLGKSITLQLNLPFWKWVFSCNNLRTSFYIYNSHILEYEEFRTILNYTRPPASLVASRFYQ